MTPPATTPFDPNEGPAEGLTLPERQLLAEMGSFLADRLADELDYSVAEKRSDRGVPVLALACTALEGLGVFAPAEHHTLWQVKVAKEDVRDHALALVDPSRAVFDCMLQAFVDYAAGRCNLLPDGRGAFVMPQPLLRAGEGLLRCGYLEEGAAGEVLWTEAIAPVMREALLWDGAGQCLSDLWAAQEEAEARLFLGTLPDRVRDGLRRTVLDIGAIEGIEYLRRHWKDGWTEVPQARPASLSEAGFRVRVYNTVVRLLRDGRA